MQFVHAGPHEQQHCCLLLVVHLLHVLGKQVSVGAVTAWTDRQCSKSRCQLLVACWPA